MNCLFVFLFTLATHGQETTTETYKKIEVVAEPEVVQDVSPPSPGLSLNQNYKLSSEDSLLEIPNVNFAGGTNRARYLQIRGQGETSAYENTPSHSVSYFIDGIDLTGITALWPQMNVASTQIFKGPQSTWWGGSSTGGVLTTQLTAPGAPSKVQISSESQKSYQAGIEVDIAKKSRLFFYRNSDPGFYTNIFKDQPGAARDEYYVSLKNELLNSSDWHISSSHVGMKTHNGYDVWSLKNNFQTLSDQQGEDSIVLHGHALNVERHLDAVNSLVSTSSAAFSHSTYSYDADWGNNSYWQSIPGWNKNYDYFDSFDRNRISWQQKLFFKHNQSSVGVHLYGLDEKSDVNHFKNQLFKEGFNSHFSSSSAALFGDLQWQVRETNTLQLAARYEAQNIRYSDTQLPGVERTRRFSSFQTAWEHHLSDTLSTRALISQGFKTPGVNIDSTLNSSQRFYDPETVTNYEIGLNSTTPSSFLGTSVFYTDQRDKQVKISQQIDPTDPSSFSYFTGNAGRARSYGLEVSGKQIFGSWQSEAQIGLLKTQFVEYTFENKSLDGRDLAHSPTWNYAAGLTKVWSSHFSSNLTFIGKNSFAFSNDHDQRSQAYHLIDLGSTYRKNHWALGAWVKNIFDERYETRGFYFANEPPNWENKLYVQYGNPRRAGVALTYQF